ncbi:MAG TPA: hypothetical protein VKA16_10980, partial [Burkholderiales bacterium]|nr:hypothetical protein [Burkholderiales bacterium]
MKFKVTALAATVVAALAAPAQAADLELKFSTFVPPTHGFVTDVLQPLGREIEKKSGGAVTVRVFAGNSPFGKVVNQAD